ncbi:MAG TPA: hypothetical protein VNX02_00085 [Steroidobacteraceae bacterium]|jgi:hypothetical protein|nr:hypothetical protein [Steroidobacteraceae bacterium]
MSPLLQAVLVAVVVGACLLYSAWRLASLALRLRLLAALATLPGARRATWLGALRARTLAQLQSGCAGCASGATPPAAGHRNRTPGALRR